jgi:hypothetical protein
MNLSVWGFRVRSLGVAFTVRLDVILANDFGVSRVEPSADLNLGDLCTADVEFFCTDPSFLRWSEILAQKISKIAERPSRNEKILGSIRDYPSQLFPGLIRITLALFVKSTFTPPTSKSESNPRDR